MCDSVPLCVAVSPCVWQRPRVYRVSPVCVAAFCPRCPCPRAVSPLRCAVSGCQCDRHTRGSVSPLPGRCPVVGVRCPPWVCTPVVPRVPLALPPWVGDRGAPASRVVTPPVSPDASRCPTARAGLAPLPHRTQLSGRSGEFGAVSSSIPLAVPGIRFPGGFSQLGLAEGSLTSSLLAGCPGGMLWQ